jgi:hypothetical protein
MKQCIYIYIYVYMYIYIYMCVCVCVCVCVCGGGGSTTCMVIQGVEMLTINGGLCYVGFIILLCVAAGVQRQRLALSVGAN